MIRAAWLAVLLSVPALALAVDPGHAAPSFTAPKVGGGTLSLEDLRGKVVLINFWATWCGPCKEELPKLEAMYRRHRGEGLVVLGVNVDDVRAHGRVRGLIERLGVTFPVVLDPEQSLPERYGLAKMPSSFVVGRDGSVVGVHAGYRAGDEARLEAKVRRALSRSASRGTPPSASE